MKGKNIIPGLQIISLHRFLQRFSMRQTTKVIITILQMPTITPSFLQLKYDQVAFQQTWCPTVLFGSKAPSAISLYRLQYQAVNFVCKLQQHFSVDNTDIQKVQWNSSLAYYKLYNQAMLGSLQDFTTLQSHSGLMAFLLQYGLQN